MSEWLPKLNAIIAGILVAVGFAMVWNPIPLMFAVVVGLGFIGLLLWLGTSPRHTWAWACLFFGLESLSWAAMPLIKLRLAGTLEPSEDQMRELASNLFLGVLFATFWLTFAYGIFRWIRRSEGQPPTATS